MPPKCPQSVLIWESNTAVKERVKFEFCGAFEPWGMGSIALPAALELIEQVHVIRVCGEHGLLVARRFAAVELRAECNRIGMYLYL